LEIYLDNAATTAPSEEFIEAYVKASKRFSNPSSSHKSGIAAAREIAASRGEIARILNVDSEEIYFTSGGTESNNIAIFGLKNKRAAYSLNQHPSVTEPLKILNALNEKNLLIPVLDGRLDLKELDRILLEEPNLICLSFVNNETGIINNIEEIAARIKRADKRILIHVDGVQGFGKFKINLKNIDTFSASAHKFHGPKGLGILRVKRGVNCAPRFFGGSQQAKLRPGTENSAAIIALKSVLDFDYDNSNVYKLKSALAQIIDIGDCVINGDLKADSPYILNVSFLGLKGETILNALSERGVYVATGSACSKGRLSENLIAHNYGKERVDSAVRFSFSKYNSISEIETALYIIEEEIKKLRRARRG
jgi:cysteine desulfurase